MLKQASAPLPQSVPSVPVLLCCLEQKFREPKHHDSELGLGLCGFKIEGWELELGVGLGVGSFSVRALEGDFEVGRTEPLRDLLCCMLAQEVEESLQSGCTQCKLPLPACNISNPTTYLVVQMKLFLE
jgi:hypothetical protein